MKSYQVHTNISHIMHISKHSMHHSIILQTLITTYQFDSHDSMFLSFPSHMFLSFPSHMFLNSKYYGFGVSGLPGTFPESFYPSLPNPISYSGSFAVVASESESNSLESQSFQMEALGSKSCDVVGLGTEVFRCVRSEEI